MAKNQSSLPHDAANLPVDVQQHCIDLPGENVQCFIHKPNLEVVLRKHRDVIFDIKLKAGEIYTVYSTESDFYNARDKLIVLTKRKETVVFHDGERLNLWISRGFKGELVLKNKMQEIARYSPNQLDKTRYDEHPRTKPEPMLVKMHKNENQSLSYEQCTFDDPHGLGLLNLSLKQHVTPAIEFIKPLGMKEDYNPFLNNVPETHEFVVASIAETHEIQPHIVEQLKHVIAIEDSPDKIFAEVKVGTDLHNAISGWREVIQANEFKETAGYLQENWKQMNKLGMKVYVEKKPKGGYKIILKGRSITQNLSTAVNKTLGSLAHTTKAKPTFTHLKTGSEELKWLGGDFERRGRATKGTFKRLMVKLGSNAKGGAKLQVIGTVIDIYFDYDKVYDTKDGSKDFSEFLGRAGVSVAKAALTAVIGSVFAAVAVSAVASGFAAAAAAGVLASAAVPVLIAVVVVVGAYIIAANIVDWLDNKTGAKEAAANYAR